MSRVSRRSFLRAGPRSRAPRARSRAPRARSTTARAAELSERSDASGGAGAAASASNLSTRVAFDGPHEAGILNPAPAQATIVALDSFAPDRATLATALEALSDRARALTTGGPIPLLELDAPPTDSASWVRITPPTRSR